MQETWRTAALLKASPTCYSAERVATRPVASRPLLPKQNGPARTGLREQNKTLAKENSRLQAQVAQLERRILTGKAPMPMQGKDRLRRVKSLNGYRKPGVTSTETPALKRLQEWKQQELWNDLSFCLLNFVGVPLAIIWTLYPYLR